MHRTRHLTPTEPAPNLKRLCCRDAQHRVREHRFQLVKTRFAEPGRTVADHARDSAADAIVAVAEGGDEIFHALARGGIRAADGLMGVDGGAVDGVDEREESWVRRRGRVLRRGREEKFAADGGDKGDNLDVVREPQVLFGNGAGGDTACT